MLIATSCQRHRAARVAPTLRMIGGLTVREIAHAPGPQIVATCAACRPEEISMTILTLVR
jgi:predicted RNA polymerase sigma factor